MGADLQREMLQWCQEVIAAAVEAHGCRSSTGDAAVVQGGHCLRDSDCGRRFRSARAIDYRSHGGRFGVKLLSCAARCRGCVCHFAHRCRDLGEHTYPCSRVQAAKIAVVPFLSFGVIAATFLVRVHLPNFPLSTPHRRGFKRVQFRHGWFGRLVSEMIHFEWLMGGYLRLAMVWSYKLVRLSILIDKPSGNLIGNPLLYIRICCWWPKSTLRLCFWTCRSQLFTLQFPDCHCVGLLHKVGCSTWGSTRSRSNLRVLPSIWLLLASRGLFLRFALLGFCPRRLVFVAGCGWSLSAGHCCWRLSFDAQGLLHAGVFFFLSVVVVDGCLLELWGFCPPGVFVFFPWAIGWLRWCLSCGVCLLALWGFCFLFLLMAAVAICPMALCGFCLWLVLRLAFRAFFFFFLCFLCFLLFSSSSSSFFVFFLLFFICLLLLLFLLLFLLFLFPFLPLLRCLLFLFLCVFSGVLRASLAWCLAFPCAWLGRPTWPLLVLVFVVVVVLVLVLVLELSSIVCRLWWSPWWRRRWWWWSSAFARLWCMASVCSLACWWLAFVRLWFWCGWLGGVCSPLVYGQRLFAGIMVVGVCSPLVLVGLVGGRRFLAFVVRSAFVCWHGGGWRLFAFGFGVVGWLVAFARLWCLVVVVACHGHALSDLGGLRSPYPSQCVGWYAFLEEFTGVCRRNTVSWRYLFRLSRSSLKCVATLGLAGAGILVLSKWCYVLLLWAVGVLPFASIASESSLSFWRSWPRAGWESYLA